MPMPDEHIRQPNETASPARQPSGYAERLNNRDYALELWKKYQDIAVHFNDLIMRWRLQAIGGLATLVTVSGFVVDTDDLIVRYRAMLILSGMLASVWIGVAAIDLFYYRNLLKGAVDSLLALEKEHPTIRLSTDIENAASMGARWMPVLFYLAGLAPLIGVGWWAWKHLHP